MAKQDEFSSTSNYGNSTQEWKIHVMETKIQPPIAEKMFHSHEMVFQANERKYFAKQQWKHVFHHAS